MKKLFFIIVLTIAIITIPQIQTTKLAENTPQTNTVLVEIAKAEQNYKKANTPLEKEEIAKEVLVKYQNYPLPSELEPFMNEITRKYQ